jgi:hypothetical protein
VAEHGEAKLERPVEEVAEFRSHRARQGTSPPNQSQGRRAWQSAGAYAGIILPENQERLLERWYAPAALEEAIGQSESWFFVTVGQREVIGFAQFMWMFSRKGYAGRQVC